MFSPFFRLPRSGVEVKGGEPLRVESGDGFILHLSQVLNGISGELCLTFFHI
jgi:hypothetical protein